MATTKKIAPTSIYLDLDTRKKLEKICSHSGESKSQAMRRLIRGADGSTDKKLAKIAAELNDLIGA
jgi:hypothetical protein